VLPRYDIPNQLPREEIAADCLVQITVKKFSPRRALKELGVYENTLEYPSVFAIVTETIRWQNTLKRIVNHVLLNEFDDNKTHNISLKKFPLFIQQLFLIGSYRTIFEKPAQPFPLVTSCITEIVKRRHFHQPLKIVNKFFHLLEKFDFSSWIKEFQDELERIVIETSNSTWLVRSLLSTSNYDEVREILDYSNLQPPAYIRINTLKDQKVIFKEFEDKKIAYFQDPNFNQIFRVNYMGKERLPNLKSFKDGYFFIQSRTSAYIPLIINPKHEDVILDACASPGGKTTFLANLMNNKGKIIAIEINESRFQELNRNLKKFGVENVQTHLADIRNFQTSEKFDIILVDAPCSGTGTLATRPYVKSQLSKQKIRSYADMQLKIIESVSGHLKPKTGLLYYVTCSLLPEENEEVIQKFLNEMGNKFQSVSINSNFGKELPYLGQRLLPNVMESEGFSIFCLKRND
jgi:16S rRNA (cytosine967-C5)-methyltransferase